MMHLDGAIACRSRDRAFEPVPTEICKFIEHFSRSSPRADRALRDHSTRWIEIVTNAPSR